MAIVAQFGTAFAGYLEPNGILVDVSHNGIHSIHRQVWRQDVMKARGLMLIDYSHRVSDACCCEVGL